VVVSPPAHVLWHELECGSYGADLALWHELAAEVCAVAGDLRAPILDVGAGAGRVSRALAAAGHHVTAVDLDEDLLARLRSHDEAGSVETVAADARTLLLERADYAACFVPMQTIQLLGGRGGRRSFLRAARAHLRPGGLLACAIVTELEPFDCAADGSGPEAERLQDGGLVYESRAVRVHVDASQIEIVRDRTILPNGGHERDVILLDRLSAAELTADGALAGFEPAGVRIVAETDEHVGSEVVLLRA
jgi:SAM-dependent methyltransferase